MQIVGTAQRSSGGVIPINPRKPLSVCEVLASLPMYRGKLIEIRGRWLGTSIDGQTCPPLRTGDYVWESAISVEMPSSPLLKLEERPATWKLDQAAYDRAERALWTQGNQQHRGVIVTFVGRLDAREEGLQTLRRPEGNLQPNGYGAAGVYPAQLVIATVKDVVPESK